MTLEDFFTLTEMKDGLAAPSRVRELVDVMQKEKDSVVKNVGDATRQWAAVASTIAATNNKDCLDLFVELDGLWFFDKYLKDAETFGNESGDGLIEESITSLLKAIEKLQIDKEKSVSSGIWISVTNLLGHKSSSVRDTAKALSASWNQLLASDVIGHSCDASVLNSESSRAEVVNADKPLFKEVVNLENSETEHVGDGRSSSQCQLEEKEDAEQQSNKYEFHGDVENKPVGAIATSLTWTFIQENPALKEKSALSSVEAEACNFHSSEEVSHAAEMGPAPIKLGVTESVFTEVEAQAGVVSCTADAARNDPEEVAIEIASRHKIGSGEADACINTMTSASVAVRFPGPENSTDDVDFTERINIESPMSKCKDDEIRLENLEDFGSFSRIKNATDDEDESDTDHSSGGAENFQGLSNFSLLRMDRATTSSVDHRKLEIDFDYGIIDPLEVARQVAQEVEREVVGFCGERSNREPLCSSQKTAKSSASSPSSPDSVHKEELILDNSPGNVQDGENLSSEVELDGSLAENGLQEFESSQVTEVAQEPEVTTDRSLYEFDLNKDMCSDDVDHPVKNPVSVPASTSVISAAATSAFRPASPLKISDGQTVGYSDGSEKQRPEFLDIDLNVSDGPNSMESSLERSEKPNLDLNCMSDGGGEAPNLDFRVFHPMNGHCSQSPASSSSSMQPSVRNFDLNDRPAFLHNELSSSSHKTSDSVISLFGSRVEVARGPGIGVNDFTTTGDANFARMGSMLGMVPTIPYTHTPVSGYDNGLTMYGSAGGMLPYMLDSRGSPVVPQMINSTATVPQFSHPMPYLMNMSGVPQPNNVDLSMGFGVEGGLRQFLIPSQSRSMEEQFRGNAQPSSSSGLMGKRKEPDGGWDLYSLPYKHPQPPWG